MDQELTFQQISVFVGANDTGKSFLLKVAFALGAIGVSPAMPPGPNSSAQFVFDSTFTSQKFNGLFKAVFTKGFVSVEIKDGEVIKVEKEGKTIPIKYMSTDMRTFDQMALYLRVRQGAGNDPITFMKKILEAYRLYDVTYMEGLLAKMPIRIPESVNNSLNSFDFKEKIDAIEADTENCQFWAVLEDGSKKDISTYGKGHQAMLNMLIGQLS